MWIDNGGDGHGRVSAGAPVAQLLTAESNEHQQVGREDRAKHGNPPAHIHRQHLHLTLTVRSKCSVEVAYMPLAKSPSGPTCLVLDVRLPGRGGLDFQRELAASNINPY